MKAIGVFGLPLYVAAESDAAIEAVAVGSVHPKPGETLDGNKTAVRTVLAIAKVFADLARDPEDKQSQAEAGRFIAALEGLVPSLCLTARLGGVMAILCLGRGRLDEVASLVIQPEDVAAAGGMDSKGLMDIITKEAREAPATIRAMRAAKAAAERKGQSTH